MDNTEPPEKIKRLSPSSSGNQTSKVDNATEAVKLYPGFNLNDLKKIVTEAVKDAQQQDDSISAFTKMVDASLRDLSQDKLAMAKLRIQQILRDLSSRSVSESTRDIMSLSSCTRCSDSRSVNSNLSPDKSMSTGSSLHAKSRGDNTNRAAESETGDDTLGSPHKRLILSTAKSRSDSRPTSAIHNEDSINASSSDDNIAKRPQDYLAPKGARLQSTVSSSLRGADSPLSTESSCPPSSTTPSETARRRSGVSENDRHHPGTSTGISGLHRLSNQGLPSSKSTLASKEASFPSFLVNSLHSRRLGGDLPASPSSSVLRQCAQGDKPVRNNDPSLKGAADRDDEGMDSPKPISSEALKVMAKNLRITVINKRANQSPTASSSSSESSDDDDSSDDDSGEEESEDEDLNTGANGEKAGGKMKT